MELLLSDFIFISLMGVHGAAIGTLLAYVSIVILMLIYLKKNLGVSPFRPFSHMVAFYRQIWIMGNDFRKNGYSMAAVEIEGNKEERNIEKTEVVEVK